MIKIEIASIEVYQNGTRIEVTSDTNKRFVIPVNGSMVIRNNIQNKSTEPLYVYTMVSISNKINRLKNHIHGFITAGTLMKPDESMTGFTTKITYDHLTLASDILIKAYGYRNFQNVTEHGIEENEPPVVISDDIIIQARRRWSFGYTAKSIIDSLKSTIGIRTQGVDENVVRAVAASKWARGIAEGHARFAGFTPGTPEYNNFVDRYAMQLARRFLSPGTIEVTSQQEAKQPETKQTKK